MADIRLTRYPNRSPITGRFRTWHFKGRRVEANWAYLESTTPIFAEAAKAYNESLRAEGVAGG